METTRRNAWNCVPVSLLGIVLLAPALFVPDTGGWRGMRVFAIHAVAFGLLALLLARAHWSRAGFQRFVRTGVNLPVLLLLAWAALSFLLTVPGEGRGRGTALVEVLRLASGAAFYFAALYGCRSRAHLRRASFLLLIASILAAITGVWSYSPSAMKPATAAFGDKQLLGAFLTGLLPVAAVFALTGPWKGRQRIATVAVALVVCALLLSVSRSSWIGSLVGLLLVVVLALRTKTLSPPSLRVLVLRRRREISLALAALALLGFVFAFSGAGALVLERMTPASAMATFQSRLALWSAGAEMIAERPLTGWGVGSFPIKFADYTPLVPSAAQVAQVGVSLSSMAHNEYLQMVAELGLVGLALYLAVLAGFFACGVRALLRMGSGTRRWLLLAVLGAVAAQCVDAIGNPGWRYRDVSPLLWLLMGLGMAAAQSGPEALAESRRRVPRAPACWPGPLARRALSGMLGGALIVAAFVGTIGGEPALAALALIQRAPRSVPGPFYKYDIVAETTAASFVELAAYSINDRGSVAFTGRMAGSDNTHVYVGGLTGGDPRNVTGSSATDSERNYFHGGVQINNAEVVVATQVRTPKSSRVPPTPAISAVGRWFPGSSASYIIEIPEVFRPINASLWFREEATFFAGSSINNTNQVAFAEYKLRSPFGTTPTLTTDLVSQGRQRIANPFNVFTPLSPMIADNGRIVVKAGNQPADPIRVYQSPALSPHTDLPTGGMGFIRLGNKPGISDDGRVVVFYGEIGGTGMNSGPGIFAAVDELGNNVWSIERLTGRKFPVKDTSGNILRYDNEAELGYRLNNADEPERLYFRSYDADARVAVIRQDLGMAGFDDDSFVVAFLATPNLASRENPAMPNLPLVFSAERGLWTVRVDVQRKLAGIDVGAPVAASRVYHTTAPLPVVQIGDSIDDPNRSVRFIEVYDPIARASTEDDGGMRTPRRGDHRITFGIRNDVGTQMVLRASRLDSDEDGLLDHWETEGIDMDGDGAPDLDLPAMGANRLIRDLFLEIDWARPRNDGINRSYSSEPEPHLTQSIVDYFGPAPALPNGIPVGIQVHIDAGAGTDTTGSAFSKQMGAGTALRGGDLVESPAAPGAHIELVYFGEPGRSVPGVVTESLHALKDRYFLNADKGARELAFHYVVFTDFHSPVLNQGSILVHRVIGWSKNTLVSAEDLAKDAKAGNAVKIIQGSGEGQIRFIETVHRRSLIIHGEWLNDPASPDPGHRMPDATSRFTLLDVSRGKAEVHFFADPDFNSLPGSDVVMATGGINLFPVTDGLRRLQSTHRTLVHELGHNLGLRHGGNDNEPYKDGSLTWFLRRKPDYRSMMNYTYSDDPAGLVHTYGPLISTGGVVVFDDWQNLKMDFHTTSIHLGNTFDLGFNATPQPEEPEPSPLRIVPPGEPLPQDVTPMVRITRSGFLYNRATRVYTQQVMLTNLSGQPITGPILLALGNLSGNATLLYRSGNTIRLEPTGDPFTEIVVGDDDVLAPGESASVQLAFDNPANLGISYIPRVLAGSLYP